jgi:hypothetical protein
MLIYSAIAGLTYIVVIFIIFYILGGSQRKEISTKSKVKTNKTAKSEVNEQTIPTQSNSEENDNQIEN